VFYYYHITFNFTGKIAKLKKKSPKIKKHKLDIGFEANFKLFGISSHEVDYKLIWQINQAIDVEFARIDNLVVYNNKLDTDQEFSLFEAEDARKQLQFYFISNRCDNGFLIKEVSNFDYFIKITGEITQDEKKRLIKAIRSIDAVNATLKLDPNCLISRDKLVF